MRNEGCNFSFLVIGTKILTGHILTSYILLTY